jgi:outer membrane usher protein
VAWSVPLGGSNVSSGVSAIPGKASPFVEAIRPLAQEPGSYGYRVRASDSDGAASAAYRSDFARNEIVAGATRTGARGSLEVEGAVAALGGGVFFANRIDDAFAVVETGTPGLLVLNENRIVGRTDSSGRALVPGLRSFDSNRIAIDPRGAPVNAEIGTAQKLVVPAERAGVRVDMGVRRETSSAIVVFTTATGAPIAVGATGRAGDGESFTVGYDGRAFVRSLGPRNEVRITLASGECRAQFPYAPNGDEQVVLGPVVCR